MCKPQFSGTDCLKSARSPCTHEDKFSCQRSRGTCPTWPMNDSGMDGWGPQDFSQCFILHRNHWIPALTMFHFLHPSRQIKECQARRTWLPFWFIMVNKAQIRAMHVRKLQSRLTAELRQQKQQKGEQRKLFTGSGELYSITDTQTSPCLVQRMSRLSERSAAQTYMCMDMPAYACMHTYTHAGRKQLEGSEGWPVHFLVGKLRTGEWVGTAKEEQKS